MSISLYELTKEYQQFLTALDDGEIPEEAIEDTLEAIKGEIEVKADNIACIIKGMEAEADALKVEADKLTERMRSKRREAERLTSYLSATLLDSGTKKVETARNKISFRKSNAVFISDVEALVRWAEMSDRTELLNYKPPEVSKTNIKKALDDGEFVPYACMQESMNIQIK